MQSLEDIPTLFASAWGIDVTSAQLIISAFVILALVLPVLLVRQDRGGFNIEIVLGFIGMSLCVGLGWLHIWVFIASVVLIALASAVFGTEVIFGS